MLTLPAQYYLIKAIENDHFYLWSELKILLQHWMEMYHQLHGQSKSWCHSIQQPIFLGTLLT